MDTAGRTVVKVSTPADILGVLPHRLGFHPTESIVVVFLHGPRRRDGLVMRLDLEPPEHDERVAEDIADRLVHAGAGAAVIACYTDTDTDTDGDGDGDGDTDGDRLRLARAPLVDALRRRLSRHGIEIVEALLVRRGRWWSYQCHDPDCCPDSGTEIVGALTPAAQIYAAETVLGGDVVLPDRAALERSVRPPRNPVADEVRAQARQRAEERMARVYAEGGEEAVGRLTLGLLRSTVQAWAEGECDLSPDVAATVLSGLCLTSVRDEAMTLVLDHEPRVLVPVLTAFARCADDGAAAPVCSVLAWVAHAAGDGAVANVAVDRALRCAPGYSLARLILSGLDGMVSPSEIMRVSAQVRQDLTAGRPASPRGTPTKRTAKRPRRRRT
ncbi:MAG TPA: DUF4192 domain-containing protein [Actinomycetes bacterium]